MHVLDRDRSASTSPAPVTRRNRGGLRSLALAAATALALTGCGAADGPAVADGIVVANSTEPENPLVPADTTGTAGGRIVDSLFAGLVHHQADGTPALDVAESIETTDAQHYTITIREGQRFSNGEPVTARSFVDAWNHGALSTNAQGAGYFFAPVRGYEEVAAEEPTAQTMSGLRVVDDRTFTVALSQPQSDFPSRLGYSAFYPLPTVAFEDMEAFGLAPVGNGPYELAGADAWRHDERIDLVVNEDYDGPRTARNEGLSFVFYAGLDAAYTDLLAGGLDVLDEVPDTALATFEEDLGERAVAQPAAVLQDLTIPEGLPHLSGHEGVLRRQAISLAVDRAQITETIFQGTRTPAEDFTSPLLPGYDPHVPGNEVLDHDPERARALWAQADAISPWEGTFEIAYNAEGGHQAWVDAVAGGLRRTLGISAEGRAYPTFAELGEAVEQGTIGSAFRSGWQADYPSQANFLTDVFRTGAGANEGGYSDPAFDALLDAAAATSDPVESAALLEQAQTVLLHDLPHIPLWYAGVSGGYGEDVSDVHFGWNSVPLYHRITTR